MGEELQATEAHQSRGAFFARVTPLRPPWVDEATLRANCTSCGDCARACPEAIIVSGPARTPMVDFSRGGCTFCGECAAACEAAVFGEATQRAWAHLAEIDDRCLLPAGISCRTCTDACDTEALVFDMRIRPVGAVHLHAEACTGCGACVSVCPVSAIKVSRPTEVRA